TDRRARDARSSALGAQPLQLLVQALHLALQLGVARERHLRIRVRLVEVGVVHHGRELGELGFLGRDRRLDRRDLLLALLYRARPAVGPRAWRARPRGRAYR